MRPDEKRLQAWTSMILELCTTTSLDSKIMKTGEVCTRLCREYKGRETTNFSSINTVIPPLHTGVLALSLSISPDMSSARGTKARR